MSKGKKKSTNKKESKGSQANGSKNAEDEKKHSSSSSVEDHVTGNNHQRSESFNMTEEKEESPVSHQGPSFDDDSSAGSGKAELPSIVSVNEDTNLSEDGGDASIFGDDDYNSGMYRGLRGRRYCLSTLRFFGITIFLWCSQYVVTSSMKHLGVLEGDDNGMRFDFDPSVVAQRVIPQLQENWNSMFNETSNPLAATYFVRQSQRPGYQLAQEGAQANYPVILIPGFVTSGLEVWTSKECAKRYFRQRIWTGLESARALFSDKNCWREHIALDPYSGMDPEGIRLRAAEGFEAADYFIANYWVWEKLLENLADLGYSPSTMSIEPYDWRMAFPLLEERDGYLTKLKYKVEAMHKSTGKKVVLTSHSMGAQLVHFFFKWVTTPVRDGGGGGGKKWVDKHVHAYCNIAGSHLGVPKAASALLSGEMKDTVIMGTIGTMAEQFFGRKLRKDLWNTWGSLWAMFPKGGEKIWDVGADVCLNVTDPEDPFCKHVVAGDDQKDDPIPFMLLRGITEGSKEDSKDEAIVGGFEEADNERSSVDTTIFDTPEDDGGINATINAMALREKLTSGDIFNFLRDWGAGLGPELASSRLYRNYGDTKAKQRNKPKVEWLDTTITPLPYAPNLKIYCMYGVGLDTERSYFYKVNSEDPPSSGGLLSEKQNQSSGTKKPNGPDAHLPFVLDTSMEDPDRKIRHGMRFTDGDGSVPLLSLGYICADAWTRKDSGLNPSGTKVITLEYPHASEFTADDPFRGGPRSADHVDILGNQGMTEDFLRVVSDFEPKRESHIVSNLREYAKAINEHPNGGIFRAKKGLFGSVRIG